MQRCDIAGGILSAVFQQVVAAHAERLGQLGDLIIRHEPNALFNAQNGYFVHFHSGKLHARGQQLQVEASGNVRCDPAWTAEALGNILKNCSEHMQEGTITVRAEENAVASVVVIRDTGGGIALQDLPHLFERYYKGENAPEQSVGIGLALSRSIAAAQNGTLTAANVPGGAEFTMKLYKGIV